MAIAKLDFHQKAVLVLEVKERETTKESLCVALCVQSARLDAV